MAGDLICEVNGRPLRRGVPLQAVLAAAFVEYDEPVRLRARRELELYMEQRRAAKAAPRAADEDGARVARPGASAARAPAPPPKSKPRRDPYSGQPLSNDFFAKPGATPYGVDYGTLVE